MNKKILAAIFMAAILIISTTALFAEGSRDQNKNNFMDKDSLFAKFGECRDRDAAGAAYTMTNDADKNEVVIFIRDEEGILTKEGSILTQGTGSGTALDPLGSQGSVMLSQDYKWLLAVNAGSNEISVFKVLRRGLAFEGKVDSGGIMPVSIAIFHNLVYILNAGGSPNITGFTLDHKGELTPLANSTRSLGNGGFAQVGFDPKGETLVVTDKADNEILVYSVGNDGLPSLTPTATASSGQTPFGFIFDRKGHLLVVEATSNAVSSYNILSGGVLQVISPSVPNGQTAACWIDGTKHGYIYTANPGTSSISSYKLNVYNGTLTLLNGTAGLDYTPLDLSIVEDQFLYAVDPNGGGVDMFKIKYDGSLINLGIAAGDLPIYSQGMAAR
jgi:6-phosphogluconolactonase